MSFQLVPLTEGTAPIIALQRPVVLIGRHVDCDVRIENRKISRRHCCVAMAYDRVVLRDLGSRNGLRVNGRLVDEVRLEPGDEVAIGPILFRFEGLEMDPAVPPFPAARPVAATAVPPPPPRAAAPTAPAQPGWQLDDSDIDLLPLEDL